MVQPLREKGHATATALLALVAGEPAPDVVLPVALRVGASTGPARRA